MLHGINIPLCEIFVPDALLDVNEYFTGKYGVPSVSKVVPTTHL